eukprot:9224101-Pyramimonas_sp.AAC.2
MHAFGSQLSILCPGVEGASHFSRLDVVRGADLEEARVRLALVVREVDEVDGRNLCFSERSCLFESTHCLAKVFLLR